MNCVKKIIINKIQTYICLKKKKKHNSDPTQKMNRGKKKSNQDTLIV